MGSKITLQQKSTHRWEGRGTENSPDPRLPGAAEGSQQRPGQEPQANGELRATWFSTWGLDPKVHILSVAFCSPAKSFQLLVV